MRLALARLSVHVSVLINYRQLLLTPRYHAAQCSIIPRIHNHEWENPSELDIPTVDCAVPLIRQPVDDIALEYAVSGIPIFGTQTCPGR